MRRQRHGHRRQRRAGPRRSSAMAAIQNARNGRSDSNELPFTTNAGTARNSSVAHTGCGGESPRQRPHGRRRDQRKQDVRGVERNLLHVAEDRQQPRQHPGIQRRMRMAAQIHLVAQKHVLRVVGMQRIDQRVRRLGQVNVIVALNRLVEKRQPEQQHQPQQSAAAAGGLRRLPSQYRLARGGHFIHAAGARAVRRALHQSRDRSPTSLAIEIMASMNWSISSLLSVSVGSIISAPWTISGKLTV